MQTTFSGSWIWAAFLTAAGCGNLDDSADAGSRDAVAELRPRRDHLSMKLAAMRETAGVNTTFDAIERARLDATR
jgi:hypothetical protein